MYHISEYCRVPDVTWGSRKGHCLFWHLQRRLWKLHVSQDRCMSNVWLCAEILPSTLAAMHLPLQVSLALRCCTVYNHSLAFHWPQTVELTDCFANAAKSSNSSSSGNLATQSNAYQKAKQVKNKEVCIVTGASSGLGLATAKKLADSGQKLFQAMSSEPR